MNRLAARVPPQACSYIHLSRMGNLFSASQGCAPHRYGRRRSYSFFSSKGNGGRYFTGNGSPKVTPQSQTQGGPKGRKVKDVNEVPVVEGNENNLATSITQEEILASSPVVDEPVTATSEATTPITTPITDNPPPPPLHPSLTNRTLSLHHFFSLHRPLLLLSQHPSSIFTPFADLSSEDPLAQFQAQAHAQTLTSTAQDTFQDPDNSERESEAALLLSHTLIASNLTPTLTWHASLAHLGSKESIELQNAVDEECVKGGILLDSTKRKRRKKMSRHKLKKRRREQREQRRKLGK